MALSSTPIHTSRWAAAVCSCCALTWSSLAAAQDAPAPSPEASKAQEATPSASERSDEATTGGAVADREGGDKDDSSLTRQIVAGSSVVGLYTGVGVWAYFAWYKGQTISDELIIRDEGWFGAYTYAGGADKLGHLYSNYIIARGVSGILQFGDFDPLTATLIANGLTTVLFTGFELKDGYHAGFGFSVGDMIANTAGNGLALLMETVPEVDRMFDLRFEYLPTDDYLRVLRETGNVNGAEDYSGQRFLLAFHMKTIRGIETWPKYTRWLRYADIVGGYQALNFKPAPVNPDEAKQQRAFVGMSVNLQALFDELVFKESESIPHRMTRFTTEVVAVPYTTIDMVGVETVTSQLKTRSF